MTGRKIAVIGGGISGLTAGYVLSRTDHVTLFEANRRLGGHADTRLAAGLRRGGGQYLRLLADVPRFHRAARQLLAGQPPGGTRGAAAGGAGRRELTFGEFLNDRGFSG